jgi:signal transduction histidine kinase
MARSVLTRRRIRWMLFSAFGGLVALFALGYVVVMWRTQAIQAKNRSIVDDALASVALVERMARDVDKERILVQEHIAEESPGGHAQLERQLRDVREDFEAAERSYMPLSTYPGEHAAALRLRAEHAAIEGPVAEVLALSRDNRDAEARRRMAALDGSFADIDRDVASLIDINRTAAQDTLAEVRQLQHRSLSFLGGLATLGTLLTVVVGSFATRLVGRREEELRSYSTSLYVRNRELDAFAGRVAHELRGPLTAISLSAERLSQEARESGTAALLRRAVERMEGLIDDLLSLSRAGWQGSDRSCDPAAEAAALAEELAPQLEHAGGTLRVAMAPSRVRCGGGLLKQALSNLADNALKYRRPGVAPELTLTGRERGSLYEIDVADNGVGMSREEARQAFDPFYRAAWARQEPGSGLGLSIVKRVMEAAGGRVALQSQPGHGSTFRLVLPLELRETRIS